LEITLFKASSICSLARWWCTYWLHISDGY